MSEVKVKPRQPTLDEDSTRATKKRGLVRRQNLYTFGPEPPSLDIRPTTRAVVGAGT
jgi:hypothetical protein